MRRVRAVSRLAVFALVASGCQLITGSFSTESGPGPVCTLLAKCCGSLSTTQEASCLEAVAGEDDSVCAAVQVGLPAGSCTSSGGQDSGILTFPDTGVRHDGGGGPPDASVRHDGPGTSRDAPIAQQDTGEPMDVFSPPDAPVDSPVDALPPDLDGAWTLTSITCEGGSTIPLPSGSTVLILSDGTAEQESQFSDGCTVDIDFGTVSISDTEISSTGASLTCGSACTTSDDCTSESSLGSFSLAYTVSGDTLNITEGESSCSSGAAIFTYTASS